MHPAQQIRHTAVETLGEIGDHTAIPGLLAILREEEEMGIRFEAAQALSRLGSLALPILLEALKDPDTDMRFIVAGSLGNIDDPAVVPALLTALQDADAGVRSQAADVLGRRGDTHAIPALQQALADETEEVRRAAEPALYRISAA